MQTGSCTYLRNMGCPATRSVAATTSRKLLAVESISSAHSCSVGRKPSLPVASWNTNSTRSSGAPADRGSLPASTVGWFLPGAEAAVGAAGAVFGAADLECSATRGMDACDVKSWLVAVRDCCSAMRTTDRRRKDAWRRPANDERRAWPSAPLRPNALAFNVVAPNLRRASTEKKNSVSDTDCRRDTPTPHAHTHW